jgi:hypothetical protein
MTDKYTADDAKIMSPHIISACWENTARLMNEAYKEGKKSGSIEHKPTCCCVEENDKLKKEIKNAREIYCDFYKSKERWKENYLSANEILSKELQENQDLRIQLTEALDLYQDSNQKHVEEYELLLKENEKLKEEKRTLIEALTEIKKEPGTYHPILQYHTSIESKEEIERLQKENEKLKEEMFKAAEAFKEDCDKAGVIIDRLEKENKEAINLWHNIKFLTIKKLMMPGLIPQDENQHQSQ